MEIRIGSYMFHREVFILIPQNVSDEKYLNNIDRGNVRDCNCSLKSPTSSFVLTYHFRSIPPPALKKIMFLVQKKYFVKNKKKNLPILPDKSGFNFAKLTL